MMIMTTDTCNSCASSRSRTIDVEGGGGCDETLDISGMGLMMICKFEYDDDACFAAMATNDGKDNDKGEGA
jgi:hypothetical protein